MILYKLDIEIKKAMKIKENQGIIMKSLFWSKWCNDNRGFLTFYSEEFNKLLGDENSTDEEIENYLIMQKLLS